MNPRTKAHYGYGLIKEAILEVLTAHPKGLPHKDICDILDLHTDFGGGSKDYLTWSICGMMLKDGSIERVGRIYRVTEGKDEAEKKA
jgi:hypothetical protein